MNWEDDDIIQQNLFKVLISTRDNEYGEGRWNGKEIKTLETSHLSNIVDMLKRRPRHDSEEIQLSKEAKIKEIQLEIDLRRKEGEKIVHSKHRFIFTEEMLIEYAKALGVKIPKSRGAIYFVYKNRFGDEKVTRIPKDGVQLRFDSQKIIIPRSKKRKSR